MELYIRKGFSNYKTARQDTKFAKILKRFTTGQFTSLCGFKRFLETHSGIPLSLSLISFSVFYAQWVHISLLS